MTILAKDAKMLMVIRARKLWLRVRIAWLDALIWGARNRLRELRDAERRETQDQWRETRRKWIAAGLIKRGVILALLPIGTGGAWAQNFGDPLANLSAAQQAFFSASKARFAAVDSVLGTLPGESGSGLGPRFNGNGCGMCHAFPALGGSSPAVNPQIAVATLDGATNAIPSFLAAAGPIREVRAQTDGQVRQLFTIAGRSDAPGCHAAQFDFTAIPVIFRIPTPLFGLGLVEQTPDTFLVEAQHEHAAQAQSLGVTIGNFNRSGNDGTITRFGWKAQNKSLLMFAGEAYNVEIGVDNELFPQIKDESTGCAGLSDPKDATNLVPTAHSVSPASDYSSDVVNFAAFMRMLGPPPAGPPVPDAFINTGCAVCHVPLQVTQTGTIFAPFSDFALHDMGPGLADGVPQGSATGSQFRTAPLWGVGKRLFFLHDGRATTLLEAIEAHAGEATKVMANFQALSAADQATLLAFLGAL